jgi:hypothetical protein
MAPPFARSLQIIALVALVTWPRGAAHELAAQGRPGGPPAPTARQQAPIDLVGSWVSVITEDWRWRMVTPARGDFASVPLTPEAFAAASAWDPAKDEAAGESCRAYGAPGLMRLPTRLRISWADEQTLRVEADAGTQTRTFHFDGRVATGPPSWQGYSAALWDVYQAPRGRGAAPAGPSRRFGSLRVVTTNLRPGYLRKNGVPYSSSAVLTEHWEQYAGPAGEQWIVVTSIVEDSRNLQQPFITSLNFKKESDGSKWAPSACSAR